MTIAKDVALNGQGSVLSVIWQDGTHSRFHAVWLRDNAQDAETRAPGNGQRLITLGDIPAETCISSVAMDGDILNVVFTPENKPVEYDIKWLMAHAYDRSDKPHSPAGWIADDEETWDSSLSGRLPSEDFATLDQALSDVF